MVGTCPCEKRILLSPSISLSLDRKRHNGTECELDRTTTPTLNFSRSPFGTRLLKLNHKILCCRRQQPRARQIWKLCVCVCNEHRSDLKLCSSAIETTSEHATNALAQQTYNTICTRPTGTCARKLAIPK